MQPLQSYDKRANYAQKGVKTMLHYKQANLQLEELDDVEIGKKLRFMRKRKGWSQEKMGEKMHLSRSNISRMESGLLPVRHREFLKWANNTNSQDVVLSIMFNIDVAQAMEILTQVASALTGVMTIFLGGIA